MIESRRRDYLQALGLEVWSVKPPEPELNRLLLQPGEGETLLICETPDQTASRIAGDIARVLAARVVWAWPDPAGDPGSPTLEQSVGQSLFTRVIVFGGALAQRVFKGEPPLVVASASITVAASLDELAVRGNAKQAFWNQLSGSSVN